MPSDYKMMTKKPAMHVDEPCNLEDSLEEMVARWVKLYIEQGNGSDVRKRARSKAYHDMELLCKRKGMNPIDRREESRKAAHAAVQAWSAAVLK